MSEWTWDGRTRPFYDLEGREPAKFVVEQTDDATFELAEGSGFQYRPPAGDPIVVTRQSLGGTDFASIPLFLSWFVSRSGRHTPAALVHDQLVTDRVTPEERVKADRTFLAMMTALDVPPVRRSVMWAAVSFATRWRTGGRTRLLLILWLAAATAGLAAFGVGIVTGTWWLVPLALIGPVPASALWIRQWKAGLIAGYALPPVVLPALGCLAGYGVYWVVEQVARRLWAVPKDNDIEDAPTPTSFKDL